MHVSVKGSTFNTNSESYLSERSEPRVAGKASYTFPTLRDVSVSTTVVGVVQQRDSDTNHSEVTQFSLNPVGTLVSHRPIRQVCERYRV